MEQLDIELKELFEGAEVAAPSGAFESISRTLLARARWRRAAYAMGAFATAAALAAAFIFIPFGGSSQGHLQAQVIECPSVFSPESISNPSLLAQLSPREIKPALQESPLTVTEVSNDTEASTASQTASQAGKTAENQAPKTVDDLIKETENFDEGGLALGSDSRASSLRYSVFGDLESNNISSRLTQVKLHKPALESQMADGEYIIPDSEANYAMPVTFGLGVRIPVSKRLSIGSGLEFTSLATFYDKVNQYEGGALSAEYSTVTNRISYIGIPLNLYCDILSNHKVSFYAYGGATVEKAIANRFHSPAGLSFKEKVEGVQPSIQGGFGVEFKLFGSVGLYLDPAVKYFIPTSSQPVSIRSRQPLAMSMDMGLRFTL